MSQEPPKVIGVGREITDHVFVHFLLQVNAECAISPNHFVGADSRVGRNISTRIRDAYIRRIIANDVMGTFDCRCRKASKEIQLQRLYGRIGL